MKILRITICLSIVVGFITDAILWPSALSELNAVQARVHITYGKTFFRKKMFNEALEQFSQACKLNPGDANAFQCSAYTHTTLGKDKLALLDLDRFVELCPKSSIALGDRAELKTRKGDLRGAVADLTRAIKICPQSASLFYERGLVFQKLGDHEAAYDDFDQSITLDNHKALSYMGRSVSEFYLSEKRNAYADCERATKLDGQSVWYQCSHSEIPIPIELRGCIRTHLGDYCGAVSDFTDAINLDRKNKRAYCGRGVAWSMLRNDSAAVNDFTVAIKLDSKFALAYRRRGNSQVSLNNQEAANSDYEIASKLDPNSSWDLQRKAQLLFSEKDYSGALKHLNKALALDPADVEALKGRAKVYCVGFNDNKNSLLDINNLFYSNPNCSDPDAYFLRGVLLVRNFRGEEALSDFNKAIELDPGYSAAYHRRALLLFYTFNAPHLAIDDLNRAIQLTPERIWAYVDRAKIRRSFGDFQGALTDCDLAVAADSVNSVCYASRARARYYAGALKGAMDDYDIALRLKPDDDDSRLRRGLLHYELGETSRCLTDLGKIADWMHVDLPFGPQRL